VVVQALLELLLHRLFVVQVVLAYLHLLMVHQ
jgi:hypothetical protein